MGSTASRGQALQQCKALKHAQAVRHARAELKRKIARGELSVPHVLLACPSHAATMPISDLLMSQRWWGRVRCRRLLVSTGVPERKPVGSLTERQRVALAALLALRPDPAGQSGRAAAGAPR